MAQYLTFACCYHHMGRTERKSFETPFNKLSQCKCKWSCVKDNTISQIPYKCVSLYTPVCTYSLRSQNTTPIYTFLTSPVIDNIIAKGAQPDNEQCGHLRSWRKGWRGKESGTLRVHLS